MKHFCYENLKPFPGVFSGVLRLILCLLIGCTVSVAQPRGSRISGTVNDSSGSPLPGVNVLEKGTRNGTMTDFNGAFTLTPTTDSPVLIFSFVGMETQTIGLEGRTTLSVTMNEDSQMLDDVVVIGYGTAKKSDLTGSVATVSQEAFSERLVTSVEDALRGQVPGVKVASTDGQPGAGLSIRIRGTGSINASNDPLYVIDGVPMESSDINPGDIESLEILKDASATAIYGSRGANGVVIITTKQGKKGKTRVNISTNTAIQQPVRLIELMNSEEYALMRKDQASAYNKRGSSVNFTANKDYFLDSEGNIYEYNKNNAYYDWKSFGDPDRTHTDWQRAMLRNALVHDYRLNVSGGDDKTTFSVMGSFFNQEGIVINSGFQKYSARINFDRQLSRWAKMGVNLNGSRAFQNGMASNETYGVTMNMLTQPPTKKLTEGEWVVESGEDSNVNNNPFFQANNIIKDAWRDNITARIYFDLNILKNLKLTVTGTYGFNHNLNQNYYPKETNQGRNENGKAQYNTSNATNWMNENLLYYTPNLGEKHKLDVMAGAIFEGQLVKRLNTETRDFAVENLGADAMQEGVVRSNTTSSYSKTRLASFLGRINYNFDNRYLFTFSMRADGSSRFGSGNKWGFFPSGAFAWRISEESFLKNNPTVSNLKLRMSVGVSGNTAIPALQSLDGMSVAFYPMDGDTPTYGIKTDRIENTDLKWETSTQYDLGVDIGLFKNRLSATVDLYYKQTRDLLFEEPVLSSTGYTSRWSNIGAIDNKGLEISLNGVIFNNRRFKWNASYNMAFNRSKVVDMGESGWMLLDPNIHPSLTNFGIMMEGEPLGNWYGFQTDGVFRKQSEIDALPDDYSQNGTAKDAMRPGETRFVNQNPEQDNVVNDDDRVILGNSEPKFTGGFTNVFQYRDFSLTIGLEFSYGGKIYNATRKFLEEFRGANNQSKDGASRWRPDLYSMTTGELVWPGNEDASLRRANGPQEMRCFDYHLEDGSYLRLNDITLSYSLPRNVLKKCFIETLRFYFSVKNAYVFTKYSGYDPDVSVAKGIYADLLPRLDYGAYPRTRAWSFGINFGF